MILRSGLVVGVGFLATWMSTPLSAWLSRRFGVIDRPNARKVHTVPTPKAGGLAILVGFWIASAVGGVLAWQGSFRLAILLALCGAVSAIGWVDDKVELSPFAKLVVVLIPAVMWNAVLFPFTTSGFISGAVGTGFLVLSMNAFNLIDGLDGLAAGVGGVSALGLSFCAFALGNQEAAVAALALGGASLGFLPPNFRPATIFMGDTGSLMIGFALGALGLMTAGGVFTPNLPVALAPLALPLYDTLIAIVRRWLHGRPIFSADKSHTYNLFVQRGLPVEITVLIFYLGSLFFGSLGLIYCLTNSFMARVLLLAIAIGVLALVTRNCDFLHVDPLADSKEKFPVSRH